MAQAELPKEKDELFHFIIRNLRTALKNSVLYDPGHPVFDFSIKNLKASLDKWLSVYGKIDLGFSEHDLLLGGLYVKSKDEACREIARYMHSRGIVVLSIKNGITEDDLAGFLSFLKNDAKVMREKGGVSKNLKPSPNLTVKEIDYSGILSSAGSKGPDDEGDIWQSLLRISDDTKSGSLPESKLDFLVDFINDPGKSAAALNKIYRQAVEELGGDKAAEEIRNAMARIYRFFDKTASRQISGISRKIAEMVSRLDPHLVVKLFEEGTVDGDKFDLAKEITKDFSDEVMADLIASLVTSDSTINENLLKVFDRLLPENDRADNVASMVTDGLLEKRLLTADTISKLQMTIKELFKDNPTSNFMSNMYKMTVDTFISSKTEISEAARKLLPLAEEYKRSFDTEKLKREEADLILNILSLEDDASEFVKFGAKLRDIIPKLLDLKDAGRIREILDLFSNRLRPRQERDDEISREALAIIRAIHDRSTVSQMITFIPEADGKDLEDIFYLIEAAPDISAGLLVDAFLIETIESRREKLMRALSRVEHQARGVIEGLLNNKNADLRQKALELYTPDSDEEKEKIFFIMKKDADAAVQDKAMAALLKTEDAKLVERLFGYAAKNPLRRDLNRRLVELSGQIKSRESVPHLRRIFLRRPLFYSKKLDELRVALVVSLRQIGTDEAMELINKGLSDNSAAVKRMCGIILELERDQDGKRVKE